jgi:hypothetical protein
MSAIVAIIPDRNSMTRRLTRNEVGAQFVARASTARDDALAEIDDEDDS